MLYASLFLYMSARNVRDLGDLLVSSTMQETPLLAINILLVLVICYVHYLGIEVLGRTAEVFIVILFLFGASGIFFIIVSGNVDFYNLRPFLENGWRPIVTTAFPTTTFFPFGEMMVFMMLLPYFNRPELVKKVWLSAVISSGLILSLTATINICVLGVDVTERATFPTLATVGKVNILEFIQRLDALVVFTLLITVFFKASILLYGTVIGFVDLFKLNNHQQILLPIGGIVIFLSMAIASNFSEHINEGANLVGPYIFVTVFMMIPLLMVLISMIQRSLKKKSKDANKSESTTFRD